MQIVRTIVWVLLLFALLAFSFFNWKPVEVMLWTNLVLETKLPALVVVSFLLGLVPMWLIHRAQTWRMNRRVAALEAATTRLATPKAETPAPVTPVQAPAPAPAEASDPTPSPIDPEPTKPQ